MSHLDDVIAWIERNPHPNEPTSRVQIYRGDWTKIVNTLRSPSREEVIEECARVCDEARTLITEEKPVSVAYDACIDMGRQIRSLKNRSGQERCPHGVWAADHCYKCEVVPPKSVDALDDKRSAEEAQKSILAYVKDAERYRFLRNWPGPIQGPDEKPLRVTAVHNVRLGADAPTGDRLDAAIDAAMNARNTEGK